MTLSLLSPPGHLQHKPEPKRCGSLALFPARRGGGERAWFQPITYALDYLGFNHVLISGRVPMTPSKSHGRLYDVAIHQKGTCIYHHNCFLFFPSVYGNPTDVYMYVYTYFLVYVSLPQFLILILNTL